MSRPDSYNRPNAATHTNPAVSDWLSKAVADMRTAERELGVTQCPNFDAVCYHAQQGIEKLMKAVLVSKNVTPPKTHDLGHLSALVTRSISTWKWDIKQLGQLSLAAVEVRYPGYTASAKDADGMFEIAAFIWDSLRPLA